MLMNTYYPHTLLPLDLYRRSWCWLSAYSLCFFRGSNWMFKYFCFLSLFKYKNVYLNLIRGYTTYSKVVTLKCKLFKITLGSIPKTIVGINKVTKIVNSLRLMSFATLMSGFGTPYEILL